MKIYCYPADVYGCGHYRIIWPAQILRSQGHNVQIVRPQQRGSSLNATLDDNNNVIDVSWPLDADVIVLQRITHQKLVQAIAIMIQRGLKVILDVDDDLAAIDPNNPAWTAMHPQYGHSAEHNWLNTQRACDIASLVTVSTEALLARYARHGRGVVLQNCVPQRYLDIQHHDSPALGWGGALHVHPGDVQVLGPTIATLTSEHDPFHVIGPGNGVASALGCSEDNIKATGYRDLLTEWPEALSALGIGIAPLADTRFNRSKSRLKILEYSALGVPWVASPRIEYQRVHNETGVGMLAAKPKHWLRMLRQLSQDEPLRRKMSVDARAWAATQTIEEHAWRWADAWRSVIDNA